MNNSIIIHHIFKGDKAVLADFVKSLISALIRCHWQPLFGASTADEKRGT
jgi:hypothetical protein